MTMVTKSGGVILPAGGYTATQTTGEKVNEYAPGLLLIVDITIAAAETITLALQSKDPVSGNWANYATFAAISTSGTFWKAAYPAAVNGGSAFFEGKNVPAPRFWRVVSTHSAGGTHTYSIAYQHLT